MVVELQSLDFGVVVETEGINMFISRLGNGSGKLG